MGRPSQNVDPAEIAKFEQMASCWWDKKGPYRALHDINELRIGYILARTRLVGSRVLDVGCGGGILSEALSACGARVTGIDAGEGPLTAARYHMEQSGLHIDYRQTTAERLAETEGEAYDAAVCFELLEHLPEPGSVIAACSGLVRPAGDLFFATINRNVKSYLMAVIGAEYLLGLLPRGTHTYGRFIKPAELSAWAESAGLVLTDITGLHYNPITRTYSMGGNRHVNYFSHFKKRKGDSS